VDTNLELKDALSIFEEASNERKNKCIDLLAPAALAGGNICWRADGDPACADCLSDAPDDNPAGPDRLSDASDGNAAGADRNARAAEYESK